MLPSTLTLTEIINLLNTSPDHINVGVLDERYVAYVQRDPVDAYVGTLYTVDTRNSNIPILQHPVTLMYGAQFGPDAQDLYDWQNLIINAVDSGPNPANK